ncbi:MAG TPA: DUF1800 domain-containing protein [Vicinamibacterales bacterium]|nr:DUF1800 domain-containing protein [Vicinamibacterales bacterium]
MADDSVAHLLRRAGFGASSDDLAIFDRLSYNQAVDRLLNYDTIPDDVDSKLGQAGFIGTTSNGPFSPNTVIGDARQRWLFRMIHTNRPLQEKMTLFWHNYFATGYTKVAGAGQQDGTRMMAAKAVEDPKGQRGQIEMLRANALGTLNNLLNLIATDPAMLIWLDGNTNTKNNPQENFGRELMELFSRGVGYYTEQDVYAAARVFTGWNLHVDRGSGDGDNAYSFIYNANLHETSAKTFSFPIYGDGSTTIPARSASAGMQDGLDLINALSTHPETARRVAQKLYDFFVSESVPADPNFLNQIVQVYLQNGTNIKPVLQTIFTSPYFTDPSVYFSRYSWPAEFVVRSIKETGWTGFSAGSTLTPLVNMGQQLFEPPDVAGWDLGQNWFSTGKMLARMNFASTLASNQKFRLGTAMAPARSSAQGVLDLMLSRYAAMNESGMRDDLLAYISTGTWSGSDAQLQTRASGLAHLIVGSAEYQFV